MKQPGIAITYARADKPDGLTETVVFSDIGRFDLETVRTRFPYLMLNRHYSELHWFRLPELHSSACDACSTYDWHELIAIEEVHAPGNVRDIASLCTPFIPQT
jgi:hypothetical protein